MIGQWVGQSRVEQPQGVATTGRFVWRTNELCRRARGGIVHSGGAGRR
ncbi:hypothetical protein LAUMK4_04710 [Mycobacterium persicum]|jgi:hypothetical protein|uniref:Transposase n=1 Tax=Mycobacterium persicum TaxID=1487726 RepID=A0ABY6RPC0_9MYCO|nr:hypothetical protein LAUMK15_05013 [Mycobacterium persicum]VAZ99768.1 hypothetical protein LAUMK4_04710 [Mycobacterium persicum]